MHLSRRGFLGGLVSALAAPAIVHAGNLMPIRPIVLDDFRFRSHEKFAELVRNTFSLRTPLLPGTLVRVVQDDFSDFPAIPLA